MKTKLWHIGIASAIMTTMGLAQAQTSPGAESPTSPASVTAPVGAAGSVPGINKDNMTNSQAPAMDSTSPAADPSTQAPPAADRDWNNSGSTADQAPPPPTPDSMGPASATPPAPSVDDASTKGSFIGVGERGNQSANNNDGLNVPPAYGAGGVRDSARSGVDSR